VIEWFAHNPWATGWVTFILMWSDWVLTILQERERRLHYSEHYASYPVNTIEGHPLLQSAVQQRRVVEPKHMIPAVILSTLVACALVWIPEAMRVVLIGYVWGLFLIVDTTHVGNLIGYRAGRRGVHGKIYLHQRTAYLMQMGRYLALAGFLILLAAGSASLFMVGVAAAGLSSAARQLVWLKRVPSIAAADGPPAAL
jgi:hypothetical protein